MRCCGLGNLEETVTVQAAAPLVDVRSAGIRDVVEQARIVELPLQTRQVTDLIALAGAAVNTGRVSTLELAPMRVAISVAGGLRTGVEYSLDGAMHNTTYDNTNLPFPFPDALQEFSVATSGLSAAERDALGRVGQRGDQVGHEQLPRERVRIPPRQPVQRAPVRLPPWDRTASKLGDGLNRNEFGGTLGGPIVQGQAVFLRRLRATRAPVR